MPKKMPSEHELHEANRSGDEQKLFDLILIIAENLVEYYATKNMILTNKDDYIQEAVLASIDKLKKYDPTSGGKIYNYISTSMLCHIRQIYRYGLKNG